MNGNRPLVKWLFLGIFILAALYGLAMVILVSFESDTIALRLINGFLSMFVGLLGLVSGYVLGRNGNHIKEKQNG